MNLLGGYYGFLCNRCDCSNFILDFNERGLLMSDEDITTTEVSDDLILAQLKSQDHSVLSDRCKGAIHGIAQKDKGEEIYLFLAMNQRIVALEKRLEFFEKAVKGST